MFKVVLNYLKYIDILNNYVVFLDSDSMSQKSQ
jgi:hypothetical protein